MQPTSVKTLICLGLFAGAAGAQGGESAGIEVNRALERTVPHYDLKAANFVDGISHLTSMPIATPHLGIEEVFRPKVLDPDRSALFSLSLENGTVRDILDALCGSDGRYTWSTDGSSINIYPKATVGDRKYLPNLWLQRVAISSAADPERLLDPLLELLPGEQLGYMHIGGDDSYAAPWTVAFEHLTVRQLVNRAAEHIGPKSSWILQGAPQDRFFSFEKGAFYTPRESERR